jgi:sulfur dioxygenase
MYFRILHDPASGELSYLLADLDAREAVLVDPRGADLPVLLALLAERELRLRWVLRTHHHDHLHPQEPVWLARLGAPLVQGQAAAPCTRRTRRSTRAACRACLRTGAGRWCS